MSGDRLHDRDYYTVTLDTDTEHGSVLFAGLDGDAVLGRPWNGEIYVDDPFSFSLQDFADNSIAIQYYFRRYEFRSSSAFRFELGSLVGWYKLAAAAYDLRARAYNRRSIVRQQRYDVLNLMVNETLKDRDSRFSAYNIILQVHGARVRRRDDLAEFINHYQLLFDSFEHEGLVRRQESDRMYAVNPSALTVLHAYQEDARRHKDGAKMQKLMILIAVVSGIAAGVQAWAAYVGMAKAPEAKRMLLSLFL